ncbi:hypothetical protein TRV_08210 [Trichophyton verrucosum HKI 0517]|uniref:Uncharacterized protein n=1 Tax=Trichophyton verrucosum (strain HKI 0517) TaxID=663202 RepID=D4DGB6_TRIVH|nr:uncharacterized protein TRV_08210 [Trichophyton verrucosum HKI 0517]EFE39106.1 hypothetical protein TRV_08210 [Trichophyton verrucosum HKI 0517]
MGRLVFLSMPVYLTSVNVAQMDFIGRDFAYLLGLVSIQSFPSSEGVFDFTCGPTGPSRSIKCRALFGWVRPGLADLLLPGTRTSERIGGNAAESMASLRGYNIAASEAADAADEADEAGEADCSMQSAC